MFQVFFFFVILGNCTFLLLLQEFCVGCDRIVFAFFRSTIINNTGLKKNQPKIGALFVKILLTTQNQTGNESWPIFFILLIFSFAFFCFVLIPNERKTKKKIKLIYGI